MNTKVVLVKGYVPPPSQIARQEEEDDAEADDDDDEERGRGSKSRWSVPMVHAIPIENTPDVEIRAGSLSRSHGDTMFNRATSFINWSNQISQQPTSIEDSFSDRERNLLDVYKLSRLVRLISLIDIVFIILFGLFSPVFFALLPFPFSGYFGAKRWSYRLLYVFSFYIFSELIGGIISLFYIKGVTFLILRICYMCGNLYIARLTTKLCSFVLVFEEDDFLFLHNCPVIASAERNMLC